MITFNGVYLPDAIPGLRIISIKRDILPPRVVNMINVPARMGAYFLNVKNDVRTYTANISISGNSIEDIRLKVSDLARILNTNSLVSLVFADESYKTFMAIAIDNTELDEKEVLAKGSIVFLIPDSVGKGATVSSDLGAAGQVHSLANAANSPAFPVFTVDFNSDSQYFSMISPEGFVLVGDPAGVTEVTRKPIEMSLNDKCEDLTPWSSTAQLDFDQAVNTGTMAVVSDTLGGGFKFKPSDYGDDATYPDKWHGPAIKRALPETLQDFRIELSIELKSTATGTGRVEFIFFDGSNVSLGKMVLWDRYIASELNTGHIYAGNIQDQHTLIASMGPKKYDWNDFFGKLIIRRTGNMWEATIIQTDNSGRYKYGTEIYRRITLNGKFTNPIASMQIHISKYGSTPAADMSVRDIRVQRINTVLTEEIPTLFSAGDQLVIDHTKGAVFLNGQFFNQHLDPASKFFSLPPGTSEVTSATTDPANTNINMEYVERWI